MSTQGNIVTYEVMFSEGVVGLDASLVSPGATSLRLLDDDSILDFTGNSLAGDGKGNGDLETQLVGIGGAGVTLVNFQIVGGIAQFELRGIPNTEYRIESSTTLQGAWSFEDNVELDGTGVEVFSDDTPVSGRKFYRAVAR